jgi:hypothetical protein
MKARVARNASHERQSRHADQEVVVFHGEHVTDGNLQSGLEWVNSGLCLLCRTEGGLRQVQAGNVEWAKGERLCGWAVRPLGAVAGQRQRRRLFSRSLSAPQELAYDVVAAPQQTPPAEMARVAGTRWAIAESLQSAKGEVGLDPDEVRSWAGRCRHGTLALLAHAYLTVARARAGAQAANGHKKRPLSAKLRPMTSSR